MITVFILLSAVGILGWGFYRARPMGKLGILAWLQSVVLMIPWLIFFGLFAGGIYLNLAGVLLLLVISVGFYIGLGNQLRKMAQDPNLVKSMPSARAATPSASDPPAQASDSPVNPPVSGVTAPTEAKIAAEDLQAIQGVFGIDTYYVIETIPYQEGAIFKGNLRGEVDATFEKLSAALQEKMGDRYRLFMVAGPDERPTVVVLPSTTDPKPASIAQKITAVLLGLATIFTCMETASSLLGFDLSTDLNRYPETLPIAGCVLLVLALHELGHWFIARRHQIRLYWPFFVPTWQIGTFGAITRFASLLPNRSVLFDIAFAGPALGGIASFGLLLLGLSLSHQGIAFQIPSNFFQGSLLVGTLARVVLGDALQQPLVGIHPFALVGWLGLVITAINLMPAGQLDGGRIVHAIYGRKVAGRATIATLIVLGIVSFVNPLALYWALLILFLQRDLERPPLNELSEPDDARAALGLLVLFLMAATLLPLTPALAGRLGIGG